MNKIEHLLACVSEECSEISQVANKALRFGLNDYRPDTGITNAEDIMIEFCDLIAVINMLIAEGALRDFNMDKRIDAKKAKVEKYMEYARENGTLE